LATPVVVMLVVVISPLAKITLLGVSPTENPPIELKGFKAIVDIPFANLCCFIYRLS
jgi:hypothetical protein